MLSRCFLDFSVGVRASVIGLSQISSFSLASMCMLLNLLPKGRLEPFPILLLPVPFTKRHNKQYSLSHVHTYDSINFYILKSF